MSKTILAGVLALVLGPGAALTASAEPARSAATSDGVIQLFGRTLCLAGAPADARCDWRAPAREPADDGLSLTLFGARYCFGDQSSCDSAAAERQDGTFRLFGMTWCTTSSASCDVVLPRAGEAASPARDMHASR